MSITLNATLKIAQDGINHRPIVSLLTSPMQSAIPLQGNNFNSESTTESNRNLIITSTGRLANIYERDDGDLYFYYTNTDRTEWQTPVLLWNNTGIKSASICELTGGDLGIIYVKESNYDLSVTFLRLRK